MAQRSHKFGTFGGVFVPSILTILGVIMYLRLPWVVGSGGLWTALGVILAAHVISITTGLSISSIATDKKVGAGGPYYIVSRSLGLPIGGTLGLALFVGLAFSISLYIIGFSESFLAYFELPASGDTLRICGSVTLVLLSIVTLISTAFAIRTQYIILSLIVLSLFSIFFSDPSLAPSVPHLLAPSAKDGGATLPLIFGIFFPAVTGFTAGVNMSGDLEDPKRSIPRGTLLAIAVGLATYLALAIFLAFRIPSEQLLNNPQVLVDIAWSPAAVLAGIWGATLSSALGSILGAPRILQALGSDRVMPHFFAKGAGESNEPRRALIAAFLIAEAGILIAELDVIARVVSIFFIATYGFLNLSCAIESWASTDFRPSFKIPRTVSVLGGLTCALIMIQLDLAATAAAAVLFAGSFVFLKRRQLALESGDTWQGVWSSLIRFGLNRLREREHPSRQWRPNLLAFTKDAGPTRDPLVKLGYALIRDRGVLTEFMLSPPPKEDEKLELPEGHFLRSLDDDKDPYSAIESAVRFHGFPGLDPNTVLLDWSAHRRDKDRFGQLLRKLYGFDLNLLLLAPPPKKRGSEESQVPHPQPHPQIDLWWAPERGAMVFGLSLLGFLSSLDEWATCLDARAAAV